MATEEEQARMKAKIDELKSKRAGKQETIAVTVSKDTNLNIQHGLNEMQQVCDVHKFTPGEVYMLASQLKWQVLRMNMDISLRNLVLKTQAEKSEKSEKKEE